MITKLQANNSFENGKDENLRVQIALWTVSANEAICLRRETEGSKGGKTEWGIKVSGCKVWLVSTLV